VVGPVSDRSVSARASWPPSRVRKTPTPSPSAVRNLQPLIRVRDLPTRTAARTRYEAAAAAEPDRAAWASRRRRKRNACCGAVRGTMTIPRTCPVRIATTTTPTIATTILGFVVWWWVSARLQGGDTERWARCRMGARPVRPEPRGHLTARPTPRKSRGKTRRRPWPVTVRLRAGARESHGPL
jgi:hypothetical protein